MLLCDKQKMPIVYKGREVYISDKVANAHYYMCNMPVNDTGVGMYVGFYLKGQEENLDEKLKAISDEDLTKIVEDGVKEEFFSILEQNDWDRVPE